MRDFHLPGRSTAHGSNGMAATSHPLSTLTAIDVLRAGGNAVDAAVAACAVQCVVEPMSTGIGGDCFCLYVPGGKGKPIGLNGSGWAPKGLSAEWLLERSVETIENESPHSVTVPGAVDAWAMLLEAHGSMGLDRLLEPAIRYAEEGWAVTPVVATSWQRNAKRLAADDGSARHYLKDGRTPRAGERWSSPALARALRAIAARGRDGFYTGEVAEDIVGYLNALGGRHSLNDFAGQHGEWVTPIATAYRDRTIYQIPPNGQGITALIMLNVLAGYDLAGLDPLGAERLHLETEAGRLAFAARDEWVADPRQADVPVAKMLSAGFADELRGRIRRDAALADVAMATGPVYRDTIYLTVVDKDQNSCSFINSLYFPFGSARTAPKTGILLQNRGAGFRVQPGHPNNVAPRKRPMHTIIPGLCMEGDRVRYSYGVMGGGYQPVGHTHVLTNMIDYGMDPQEAVDLPRVFHVAGRLDCENGVPEATMQALAALGHTVQRPEMPWGGGQIIEIDWRNGTLIGGSDPRKDGMALGY